MLTFDIIFEFMKENNFLSSPKSGFKSNDSSLNKKWSFPLKISSVNVTKSALILFTEEVCNGTLHFVCIACINQLISITYSIFSVSLEVCDTSLDFSKAFDRIWHKVYLYKVNNSKINGNLLVDLLELFLYSRRPKVVLNGKSSNWKFVKLLFHKGFYQDAYFFIFFVSSFISMIYREDLLSFSLMMLPYFRLLIVRKLPLLY